MLARIAIAALLVAAGAARTHVTGPAPLLVIDASGGGFAVLYEFTGCNTAAVSPALVVGTCDEYRVGVADPIQPLPRTEYGAPVLRIDGLTFRHCELPEPGVYVCERMYN
jgi:hypothetical protein